MAQTVYEADTISVTVTVYSVNSDGSLGSVYDLTGATVACFFGQVGQTSVTGTATITNAAGGLVNCAFPAGTAKYPNGNLQLQVTKSGVTTTVVDETFNVMKSLG